MRIGELVAPLANGLAYWRMVDNGGWFGTHMKKIEGII
jgi:hypothetical protein